MADICEETLENLASRLPCVGPPFSDRLEVPMPKLVGSKTGGKQPAALSHARTTQQEEKRAAWLLEEPTWRWWNSDIQTYSIEIRAQCRLKLARSSSCGSTCGAATMSPTSPPAPPEAPIEAPAPEPEKPQKRRDEAWSWWDEDLDAYVSRPMPALPAPGAEEAPSLPGAVSAEAPGAVCVVASPSGAAPHPMEPAVLQAPLLPPAASDTPHPTESAVLQAALLPPASVAPQGASPASCVTLSPGGLEGKAEAEAEAGAESEDEDPEACWARLHMLQSACLQHISSMSAHPEDEEGAPVEAPNPESPTRQSAASQTDSPSPMLQVPACAAQAWMPTALVSPAALEAIGCPAIALGFGALPPAMAPVTPSSGSPEVKDAVQLLQRGAAEMSEARARIEATLEALSRDMAARWGTEAPHTEEPLPEAPQLPQPQPQLPQLREDGAQAAPEPPPEESELSRTLAAMQSTVASLQETHDRLTPLRLADLDLFGPPPTATLEADVGGVSPHAFFEGAFSPETPADELWRQGFAGFALMSQGTCGSMSPSSSSPGNLGIRVVAESGIPDKAVLSLKVGDVRRQAQIAELRRQALRFRTGPGPAEVAMTVFRTLAAGSFVLHPEKAEYTVALHGEDGRALEAKLLVTGHRDVCMPMVSSATADPYFQTHQLLPYVAALFQAAILERAADPFAFMEARVRELLFPRAPKPRGHTDDSASASVCGVELRLMPYELLPEGCVVSVRLGSERKHVRASSLREKGVRFSAGALAPLKISILAPEATQEVQVVESSSDRRVVRLSMENMSLDVVILRQPEEGATEAQDDESQLQPEDALDDESYSRSHGLVRAAYDLFRKLGDTKPEEPFQFVLRYLQEFRMPTARG